jgi:hypothetical protein
MTAASAMAANGFVRYALGGVFPLFTIQSIATLYLIHYCADDCSV